MNERMDNNEVLDYLGTFKSYLETMKMPLTAQREQILHAAFSIDNHFSAEDLAEVLKKSDIKIGMATIYRTLGLMVSAGMLKGHDFGDGFRRYERKVDRSHHDHLICENCGGVTEFEAPAIEKLQAEVIDLHNFRASSHKLEIYGFCELCSGRK